MKKKIPKDRNPFAIPAKKKKAVIIKKKKKKVPISQDEY